MSQCIFTTGFLSLDSPAACGAGAATLPLFYRNAFRQVAGLVYVGAFEDGDVVGEELDRDRVEEGSDKRVAIRHRDAKGEPVGEPGDPGCVRDHHDAAAAGHDLLAIAEGLFEKIVVRR